MPIRPAQHQLGFWPTRARVYYLLAFFPLRLSAPHRGASPNTPSCSIPPHVASPPEDQKKNTAYFPPARTRPLPIAWGVICPRLPREVGPHPHTGRPLPQQSTRTCPCCSLPGQNKSMVGPGKREREREREREKVLEPTGSPAPLPVVDLSVSALAARRKPRRRSLHARVWAQFSYGPPRG